MAVQRFKMVVAPLQPVPVVSSNAEHGDLDIARVQEIAREQYRGLRTADKKPYIEYALRAGKWAGYIAQNFILAYADRILDPDEQKTILTCRCAAILRGTVDYGYADFERICHWADASVAMMTCVLSVDRRLPVSRRGVAYRQQVGASSWEIQAIALADLLSALEIQRTCAYCARTMVEVDQLNCWTQEGRTLLGIFNHLRGRPDLKTYFRQAESLIDSTRATVKDTALRISHEKLAQNVRNKIAARQ